MIDATHASIYSLQYSTLVHTYLHIYIPTCTRMYVRTVPVIVVVCWLVCLCVFDGFDHVMDVVVIAVLP